MRTSEHPENPEISLIYVNFQSVRILRKAIGSLLRSGVQKKDIEVIVANNDPSESWAIRALLRNFPIRIIELRRNVGFGAAANVAASHSRASYLGFINPDTELFLGEIKHIPEVFKKYQDIGILGAMLLSKDGYPEVWSAGEDITFWQIIRNNIGIPAGKRIWRSKKPREAGFVSGAALFVRKNLFDRLHGFDEQFFLYFEDADLCFRSRQSGYRVFFFPSIVFRHDGGRSHFSQFSKKSAFYESQRRYFKKHRPMWEQKALSVIRKIFL